MLGWLALIGRLNVGDDPRRPQLSRLALVFAVLFVMGCFAKAQTSDEFATCVTKTIGLGVGSITNATQTQ